jgi:hypothetical protein
MNKHIAGNMETQYKREIAIVTVALLRAFYRGMTQFLNGVLDVIKILEVCLTRQGINVDDSLKRLKGLD